MKKDTTAKNKPKPTARQGLGRTGERLAAEALISKGYHILERNFRCRQGEIDLVAEDEQDLIFVEVKARRGVSFGLPEDALTIYKRGINSCPKSKTMLDNSVFAALVGSGLPKFLPHIGKLFPQELPSRRSGLELHLDRPAIAPPLCVPAHLQAGLACHQRGVPPAGYSQVTSSHSGRVPIAADRLRWALPMQLVEKAVMHVH